MEQNRQKHRTKEEQIALLRKAMREHYQRKSTDEEYRKRTDDMIEEMDKVLLPVEKDEK